MEERSVPEEYKTGDRESRQSEDFKEDKGSDKPVSVGRRGALKRIGVFGAAVAGSSIASEAFISSAEAASKDTNDKESSVEGDTEYTEDEQKMIDTWDDLLQAEKKEIGDVLDSSTKKNGHEDVHKMVEVLMEPKNISLGIEAYGNSLNFSREEIRNLRPEKREKLIKFFFEEVEKCGLDKWFMRVDVGTDRMRKKSRRKMGFFD